MKKFFAIILTLSLSACGPAPTTGTSPTPTATPTITPTPYPVKVANSTASLDGNWIRFQPVNKGPSQELNFKSKSQENTFTSNYPIDGSIQKSKDNKIPKFEVFPSSNKLTGVLVLFLTEPNFICAEITELTGDTASTPKQMRLSAFTAPTAVPSPLPSPIPPNNPGIYPGCDFKGKPMESVWTNTP